MLDYLRDYFKDWILWDYCWVFIASCTGLWLGLTWGEGGWRTWLSIITCLTGLWCVILVAKGRIFNYYLGIVNVLGYAYIAYGYQLYGEVQLNLLYFLPMQFYGLWVWRRNKDFTVKDKVVVKFMTNSQRVVTTYLSLIAVGVYAWWLKSLGDPLPYLDSASTILSIIAMMLMAWRYMEQWILWIIVDIVSIWMWIVVLQTKGTNDIAMLVMWSAYLINAIYGFMAWIWMYKDQQIADGWNYDFVDPAEENKSNLPPGVF